MRIFETKIQSEKLDKIKYFYKQTIFDEIKFEYLIYTSSQVGRNELQIFHSFKPPNSIKPNANI